MIEIPIALQDRLDSGVTTLAWCWRLTRVDGQRYGFTDHDRPLTLDGLVFRPSSGFSAGSARAEMGAAPARAAVFGALNASIISAVDLDNGVWDTARVELFRVDWSEPSLSFKTFTGQLGAVTRSEVGFEAEVTGLSARLSATIGRVFSRSCDAELGDERCGLDLQSLGHVHTVEVDAVLIASGFVVTGAGGVEAGGFKQGVLRWTSGLNAGVSHRVLVDRVSGDDRVIELDRPPANLSQAGDAASLTIGCDKSLTTCQKRFSNALNFRGCPHMPGNDVLLRHAASEDIRDGLAR